jgi:hypothetical protein
VVALILVFASLSADQHSHGSDLIWRWDMTALQFLGAPITVLLSEQPT